MGKIILGDADTMILDDDSRTWQRGADTFHIDADLDRAVLGRSVLDSIANDISKYLSDTPLVTEVLQQLRSIEREHMSLRGASGLSNYLACEADEIKPARTQLHSPSLNPRDIQKCVGKLDRLVAVRDQHPDIRE
jgi:hypothetical protein